MLVKKGKDWLKRYFVAEVVGVAFGLLLGLLVYFFTKNLVVMAFVATWSENIGYYGFIAVSDVMRSRKLRRLNNARYGVRSFFKNISDLFFEFGFSEVLDSFFIRPFCLYIFPVIMGNVALGLFMGMMVANIIFYIPVIIIYEIRKKRLKEV